MGDESLIFVLEEELGHRSHARNIRRALTRSAMPRSRFVRIDHSKFDRHPRLPFLANQSLRYSWSARRAVRRLIAEAPADGLFVHTQTSSLFLGDVMGRLPTVLSMDATPMNYDSVGHAYGHSKQMGPVEGLKRTVNREAFRRSAALVTFSHWAAVSLSDDYGIDADKITVLPPGVDLHRFTPARGSPPSGPVRVLFVGGDFQRKGGEDLLGAVSQLQGMVELDVVTSAQAVRNVPGIRFHTGLSNKSPELPELYRSADIFALPTHGDCSPIAIVEAMASALPVAACRVGGVGELVAHGESGFLVPTASPDHLARMLRLLVEHPDLRIRMGERGLETARRSHDAERNVGDLIELVRRTARQGVQRVDVRGRRADLDCLTAYGETPHDRARLRLKPSIGSLKTGGWRRSGL